MRSIQFYQTLPEMECLQGDTLPGFRIFTDQDDASGSMKLILEMQNLPGAVVLEKECLIADNAFHIQLTSEDTSRLNGYYQMHFCLTDANGLQYRKLAGTLNVKPAAQR